MAYTYKDHPIYKAHEKLGFPALPHSTQLDILLNGNYEPILSLTPEFRKDGFPLGLIREYITMSKAEFKAYLQATNFMRLQEKEYSKTYDGFWYRYHEHGFVFFERERGQEFNHKVVKTKDEILDLFVEQYWRWCK